MARIRIGNRMRRKVNERFLQPITCQECAFSSVAPRLLFTVSFCENHHKTAKCQTGRLKKSSSSPLLNDSVGEWMLIKPYSINWDLSAMNSGVSHNNCLFDHHQQRICQQHSLGTRSRIFPYGSGRGLAAREADIQSRWHPQGDTKKAPPIASTGLTSVQ